MGRTTEEKDGVKDHPVLFTEDQFPLARARPDDNFASIKHPLWSEEKARLIQEYLKLFTFVTKHGTYIDGFAAPQWRDRIELCSANLVLETEPKWIRKIWLCDNDPKGLELLEEIRKKHDEKGRTIHILRGDFNETVQQVLSSGDIGEKTAAFALLDQRTFECSWSTVEILARHKSKTKIEQFYFFPTGWIDRSLSAVQRPETKARVERWWGRPDWKSLQGMDGVHRAQLVKDRFLNELGYEHAHPYAIHDKGKGRRTMYHMIHATDHDAAPELMRRAYRKIAGTSEVEIEFRQLDLGL